MPEDFRDAIGLSPKSLSRISASTGRSALSRQDESDWADLAADCGYADQAHLRREFAEFAGTTPAAGWPALKPRQTPTSSLAGALR